MLSSHDTSAEPLCEGGQKKKNLIDASGESNDVYDLLRIML